MLDFGSTIRQSLVVALCWLGGPGSIAQESTTPQSLPGVELTVAAAAELDPALTEVAQAFEQKTGKHVRLNVADPAKLYSEVRKEGTFDAFFPADMSEVRRLVAAGTALGVTVTQYAHDELALCVSPMVRIDFPPRNPLVALREKVISRIAIADAHTAAGRAVLEALKAARIYDFAVRRKLLIGKNSAEVADFEKNGNSDVALLPMSAIRASLLGGTQVISIPSSFYRPIPMGAVVLRRSKHHREALEFLKFVASPTGQTILRKYGFHDATVSHDRAH